MEGVWWKKSLRSIALFYGQQLQTCRLRKGRNIKKNKNIEKGEPKATSPRLKVKDGEGKTIEETLQGL